MLLLWTGCILPERDTLLGEWTGFGNVDQESGDWTADLTLDFEEENRGDLAGEGEVSTEDQDRWTGDFEGTLQIQEISIVLVVETGDGPFEYRLDGTWVEDVIEGDLEWVLDADERYEGYFELER